jgi:hypothetical protein
VSGGYLRGFYALYAYIFVVYLVPLSVSRLNTCGVDGEWMNCIGRMKRGEN